MHIDAVDKHLLPPLFFHGQLIKMICDYHMIKIVPFVEIMRMNHSVKQDQSVCMAGEFLHYTRDPICKNPIQLHTYSIFREIPTFNI